jgi:O-acetyl-ADP-ribose deacetylase (regulator of RNase III)
MIEIINGNIFDGNDDIICHQVNTYGVMGAGIALQIKEKFPEVFAAYEEKCRDFSKYDINPLGHVLYCRTKYSNVVIANLFSQIGMTTDYNAIKNCLQIIYNNCKKYNETVAIPYKMGCGIAKGDWNKVYGIIEEIFSQDEDVKCTIYKMEE